MPAASWFCLQRHEGDATPPTPPAPTAPPPAPAHPEDEAAEQLLAAALGEAGKRALDAERTARKAAEKAAADNAAKLKTYEDAQKTEAERLASRAADAEKAVAAATARAVRAEVRALADGYADREDAVVMLGDLARFSTNGDIDTAAIQAELAAVLERKPHLKATPAPRGPAPDPSQGRGGNSQPTDFRTASRDDYNAELAKYGMRPTRR